MGNKIAQKTWAIWLLHTVADKQIWLFRWLPAAQTLWGEVVVGKWRQLYSNNSKK